MKIILIRHVETLANYERRYIGHTKSEYTEKGRKQINNILDMLVDEEIDMIYSSPLPRAKNIAKICSEKFDKEVIVDDALIEMNFGIFEGKTYQEVKNEYNEEWEKWTKDYKNYKIPKGENLVEVYKRVTRFIDKLKEEDKTFLIVTHGGIIHTIITYLLDLKIDKRWHFKIPPGAIVEIEFENKYGIITKLMG